MKSNVLISVFMAGLILLASSAYATYINYATNLSANWISNPAGRHAATDSADGVVMNPAGLVRMDEGLHIHFSSQSLYNPYKIEMGDSYQAQSSFKQERATKFVPSIYANYKKDDWSFFGGFYFYGGGGSIFFSDGTPNVNMALWGIDNTAGWTNGKKYFTGNMNDPNGPVGAGASVEILSMMPALTFGAARAVNEKLSVAAGARLIYGYQSTQIDVQSAGLFGSKDTLYDAEWSALGGLLFVSVNYQPVERLNLAFMIESLAPMDWEVDVKKDLSQGNFLSQASGYTDKRSFRFDEPTKIFLGADYALTDRLNMNGMFILYLPMWGEYKKPAPSTFTGQVFVPNEIKYDLDPGFEIGVGGDYKISENTRFSAGIAYAFLNYDDKYQSEALYKNNFINLGTGVRTRVNNHFTIGVGYMRNVYFDVKNTATRDHEGNFHETTYKRPDAHVLAFSLEYSFR
ncbi:hypothetical protein OOT00_14630 [Desulfobotulus sp. H1]|uniref:Long-chain fatty acid transport protein n=1 Tax=Desulfobotulus pelophilus TaxID=2823377 RepID=A0ABT3NDH2_9BACT|nr:hypothetical protein [Desulfobotulus pelophilus]MCW7755221.1 hypothetical protein [Desulfobotulus pelophilus]